MDFYLDFEATRFSNRIISVGCSAGNCSTFSSLVKPPKGDKVDKFIEELTGITNEMLAEAPTADEVFSELFDFISDNSNGNKPTYYVYGNCDIDFLKATLKHMSNAKACMCVQAIMGGLVDYAPTVKKFFATSEDLALRKVYMLVKSCEFKQKHDALEDALMLQTVVENLHDKCKPEDKAILRAMPSQKKPKVGNSTNLPEYWNDWNNCRKEEAVPTGDENNWKYMAVDDNGKQLYFTDMESSIYWVIKFQGRNLSPKKQEHLDRVRNSINRSIQNSSDNKKKTYGYKWYVNKGDKNEK